MTKPKFLITLPLHSEKDPEGTKHDYILVARWKGFKKSMGRDLVALLLKH
jgi:hypothetical protein